MKPCTEYLELMNNLLDGEATQAQESELSAHLARCSACAALYEDLKAIRAGSDALVIRAPEGFADSVMSRITAEASNVIPFPQKAEKKKPAGRWRSWAAMAAVFALVIGVGATQDLFGGSSSAPSSPATPGAAPAAQGIQEPEEGDVSTPAADYSVAADVATASENDDRFLSGTSVFACSGSHQALEDLTGAEGMDQLDNATVKTGEPAEAAPVSTAETSDLRLALEMVVNRICGESGYTIETEYVTELHGLPPYCASRLLDGESVVDEGRISYTGLSPNGQFYCFAWSWEGQSNEEAQLYRYAVPMDLSYVMWAGDTPDMENYRSALEN